MVAVFNCSATIEELMEWLTKYASGRAKAEVVRSRSHAGSHLGSVVKAIQEPRHSMCRD